MIVKMDTRPVNAFKLKIWANDLLMYDDVVFSQPDVKIELDDFSSGKLVLKWDFYFTEKEITELKRRKDFPVVEEQYSYYFEHDSNDEEDADVLAGIYIEPASSIYYTIVENILPTCKILKLGFIETELVDGLLLLDVISTGNPKFGKVRFKKSDDADILISEGKKFFDQEIKKDLKSSIKWLIVFIISLIISLLVIEIKWIVIGLGIMTILSIISFFMDRNLYERLVNDTKDLDEFTVVKGNIVPINKIK